MFKKIISFICILLILSPVYSFADEIPDPNTIPMSDGEVTSNYFIVTAYYSPLPDQKSYITGNFEDEKKLNGNGVRGASGKPVFSGMLAGPKTYAFGTKIKFEGIGVGVVEDRGGAIVNAGDRGYEYDRIDIWVGFGDEGLKRAIYWGKRKISGKIVANDTKVTLNIANFLAPDWTTKKLTKVPDIFNIGIGKGSDEKDVVKLQNFLKNIGIYNGEINGLYDDNMMNLIYNYQVENNIIKDSSDFGAGYWGNLTRKNILKRYLDGEFDKAIKINSSNKAKIKIEEPKNSESTVFDFSITTEKQIKDLQDSLKKIGLYNGEIDGNYESVKKTILDYQISKNLIKDKNDLGAGTFGPKTRSSLKVDYLAYLENEKLENEFQSKIDELKQLSEQKAIEKIEKIGTPEFGEVSPRVRELQSTLSKVGYFDFKDTAIFGESTKQSIISYQLDKNIISSIADLGAGLFGPKTKEKLKQDLKDIIFDEIVKDEKLEEKMDKLLFKKLIKKV